LAILMIFYDGLMFMSTHDDELTCDSHSVRQGAHVTLRRTPRTPRYPRQGRLRPPAFLIPAMASFTSASTWKSNIPAMTKSAPCR
jgi:hypothetical protein